MVVTTKVMRPKGDLETAVRAIIDYYFDYLSSTLGFGQAAPKPKWLGSGALALELDEHTPVTRKIVSNLMWAKSPDGTQQLIDLKLDEGSQTNERDGETSDRCKHVPAVDVCLSPPKSVSVFWQQCSATDRERVIKCIERAVEKFVSILESEVELSRRGKAGSIHQTARLTIASFMHAVSRDMEPLLHVHLLAASMCQAPDGTWGKLDSKRLLAVMRDLSVLFSNDCYLELYKEFGVLAHRPKTKQFVRYEQMLAKRDRCEANERFDDQRPFSGAKYENWFELNGISKAHCDDLSTRRKSILEQVAVSGANSSSNAARQLANLKTRQEKDNNVTTEELEESWNKIAVSHGLTPDKVKKLMGQTCEINVVESLSTAVEAALKKITSSSSTFDRLLLMRHVSEEVQALPIGSDFIREHVSEVLRHSPQIVQLREGDNPLYTTKEMWDIEQKFVEQCKVLDQRKGPVISEQTIAKVIAKRPSLLDEQKAAVEAFLRNESSLRLLSGIAGAGKSYVMDAVREAYELSGYKVVVAAVAANVAKKLGDDLGVPSFTIAQIEYHLGKSTSEKMFGAVRSELKRVEQSLRGFEPDARKVVPEFDSKTAVIVDEGSMLGTRMLQQVTESAVKTGFTLDLLGDTEQLSAIEAGAPFEYLINSLTSPHLRESFRQRHAEDREAAELVRNGEAEKAINSFVERGLLNVTETRADAIRALVDKWVKDGNAYFADSAAILTYTREEAKLINAMCQARRLEEGTILTKNYKIDDQKLHVNDRVMFEHNFKHHGVFNGTLAKVHSISLVQASVTFQLEGQRKEKAYLLDLDRAKELVTIPIRELSGDRITLGYAATNHKIQGATCINTYALLGGRSASRESAYVQVTRAKESTNLFIDSNHAGEELALITKAIKRSEKKHMALDVTQHHELKIRLEKK